MNIFEKLEDTVSTVSRDVADKAKTMAEITSLKGQIATCEDIMKKNYMEIGKMYYEEYKDVPDAPFEKQCKAIEDAQRGVRELQDKINILRR